MKGTISFIFLLILFSCSTQKEINKASHNELIFGSGGGITNQIISYKLQDNGKLWKYRSLEKDSSLMKFLKKKEVNWAFTQATNLGLDTLKLDNLGNTYYFIILRKSLKENKITWTDSTENPSIREFYNKLFEFIKTN